MSHSALTSLPSLLSPYYTYLHHCHLYLRKCISPTSFNPLYTHHLSINIDTTDTDIIAYEEYQPFQNLALGTHEEGAKENTEKYSESILVNPPEGINRDELLKILNSPNSPFLDDKSAVEEVRICFLNTLSDLPKVFQVPFVPISDPFERLYHLNTPSNPSKLTVTRSSSIKDKMEEKQVKNKDEDQERAIPG